MSVRVKGGEAVRVGVFDRLVEAARAYDVAVRHLIGEGASTNYPREVSREAKRASEEGGGKRQTKEEEWGGGALGGDATMEEDAKGGE